MDSEIGIGPSPSGVKGRCVIWCDGLCGFTGILVMIKDNVQEISIK